MRGNAAAAARGAPARELAQFRHELEWQFVDLGDRVHREFDNVSVRFQVIGAIAAVIRRATRLPNTVSSIYEVVMKRPGGLVEGHVETPVDTKLYIRKLLNASEPDERAF